MDRTIKVGFLSGLAGAVLGITALSLGGHLIDAGKRAIGIGPRLEITTHICSPEQLPNLSEKFNSSLKEKAITDKGYTEIRTTGGFTYTSFDIIHNYSPIAHNSNYGDFPLFMSRLEGNQEFIVHSDSFGDHQTFKPKIGFIQNDHLLGEIFAHARKNKDQLYKFCKFNPKDDEKKDVPTEYKISLGGVNYEVHNLSVLTGGDTNVLKQLWMSQVVYK